MLDAARRAVAAGGRQRTMSIFVDETTKVVYQGLTGSQGRFYGLRNREYGTQRRRRHQPEEGRHRRRRHPDLRHRRRGGGGDRRQRVVRLHPRAGRPDAVIEAAEGGIEFVVVHHRGRAGARRGVLLQPLKRDFPDMRLLGPNCPGHHHPGQVQHRHHRRRDREGGRSGRDREPLRHAHVPGAATS